MTTKLTQDDIKVQFNKTGDAEITILKGDDVGIVFKYGKVSIDENEDGPSMSFGYEIISGTPNDKPAFEETIAHLLHEMILYQLETGELQYSGGTDVIEEARKEMLAEKELHQEPMVLPQPGVFTSKKGESAMSFLDSLAAQGMEAMKR